MADNTQLNAGSGGDVIATDDIGGIKHQLNKLEYGDDGAATQVSHTAPLPTTPGLVSPQTHLATSASLAPGGSTDLDSLQISSGLTGKLVAIQLESSAPLLGIVKTVLNGVETSRARIRSGPEPWVTPSREFITQAQDAGAGLDAFRVTVTNLDTGSATTDVSATFFYDEV